MDKVTLYCLLATRSALKSFRARTVKQCPMLNALSGEDCYFARQPAISDGDKVTRCLRAPDDFAVVHVSYPFKLHLSLCARGEISKGDREGLARLSRRACTVLNRKAEFMIEVFPVHRG